MSVLESGRNLELIQVLTYVIVTCKYEKDPINNSRENLATPFPHYNPMGAICCHGDQSSDPIWPKTLCRLSPTLMMLQIKFGCNSCLKLLSNTQTHGRWLESHPINSPLSPGELKIDVSTFLGLLLLRYFLNLHVMRSCMIFLI